jgi:hypothetical protein
VGVARVHNIMYVDEVCRGSRQSGARRRAWATAIQQRAHAPAGNYGAAPIDREREARCHAPAVDE